jgi:outer membrane murein-binding lipoprotein Lpp
MPALLLRFWPYIAGALIVGLLLLRVSQLSGALEDKRNELATANARIEVQNAGVERLRSEGQAAQARADAAVAEALRANDRQQPVIVSLRESAGRVRGAGERCEISETLRSAEGL